MAILKLARMGHPVLLARAQPVDDPTAPEIRRLLADMIETLEESGGVGLAAPQVHVPLRLFIYKVPERRITDGDGPHALSAVLNPVLTLRKGEIVEEWEGRLSIPGLTAMIPRARRITLRGTDADGVSFIREATGFHARVIQHETDHLDGILYPARMRDMRMIGYTDEIVKYRDDIMRLGNQSGRPVPTLARNTM